MSSPALKVVPQVNLDEFERRLRAAGAPADAHEDPLAELARLVGLDVGAAKSGRESAGAPAPQAPPVRLPHIDEPLHEAGGFDRLLRVSFADEKTEAEGVPSPAFLHDESPVRDDEPVREAAPSVAVRDEALQAVADPTPAPRRSSRVKLTMGVLVGLGAAGLVAAWAVKGAPGLPKTPPVILAVEGPTKVQPPTQDTIASPSDSASVLLKDPTSKPGPVKLVSNEEQPVDLREQTPSASLPGAQTPDNPVAALATVAATAAPPAAPAPFPEPKRVKTVSVRPDGSLILAATQSADAGPAAAPAVAASSTASAADTSPPAPSVAPPRADNNTDTTATMAPATRSVSIAGTPAASAPVASEARAADTSDDSTLPRPSDVPVPKARPSFLNAASGAAPQTATPKLDLPARPSGKSTARVPVAKIDTTVVGATSQAPESPLQIVPDLLGSVAKAVTGQSRAQPATQVASAEPVAAASAPVAKSEGPYDVQLAAPGSEQEAQSASTRLRTKYATELSGLEPTIHQAEVNGRSIYRVRVSGMSKAEAVALCVKLKAAGGDAACFVARN